MTCNVVPRSGARATPVYITTFVVSYAARPRAVALRSRRPEYHKPAGASPPVYGGRAVGRQAGRDRGAACQNRTDDLLITSEMLYQLS